MAVVAALGASWAVAAATATWVAQGDSGQRRRISLIRSSRSSRTSSRSDSTDGSAVSLARAAASASAGSAMVVPREPFSFKAESQRTCPLEPCIFCTCGRATDRPRSLLALVQNRSQFIFRTFRKLIGVWGARNQQANGRQKPELTQGGGDGSGVCQYSAPVYEARALELGLPAASHDGRSAAPRMGLGDAF